MRAAHKGMGCLPGEWKPHLYFTTMSLKRFAVSRPHPSVRNTCIFCSCLLFPFSFELYCSLMAVLPF